MAVLALQEIVRANATGKYQTHGRLRPVLGIHLRRRQPPHSITAWPHHREALRLGTCRKSHKMEVATADPADHPEGVEAEAEVDMAQACEEKPRGPWEKSCTKLL